jgi:nucleotide-binding universal stress UspA family protein
MFLLLFSFANISLITLRRKMPYLQRGFVVPLVPVVPLVATGLNIALAIYLFQNSPVAGYIAIVWIEFGLIGYYFTRGKEEISDLEKIEKIIGTPRRETGKKYHVLVPIANPNNTELIDIASNVAKHRDGDMILLNIAAIPDTIPIQNVDYDFVNKRVKIAESLSEYSTTKHNVTTRARVVVSHKIRDTILETVNKEKANFTIIGWSGKPPQPRIMFGYNIDDIIQFAKSDVAILKGPIKGKIRTILTYPGFGDHADRATEVSAYIAKEHGARVTIVGLISPSKSEAEVKHETNRLAEIVRSFGVYAEEKVIRTKRPVGKLDGISKDYDLVVMGADEKWKLLSYAFGPIQDSLSKRVTKPLLLVRAIGEEEVMISTSDMGEGKADLTPTPRPVEAVVGVAEPVDDMGQPENNTSDENDDKGEDIELTHASISPPSVLEPDTPEKEPDPENDEDRSEAAGKSITGPATGKDELVSDIAEVPGKDDSNGSSDIQPDEAANSSETTTDDDKILNVEPSIPEEMEDEDGAELPTPDADTPLDDLHGIEHDRFDGGDEHD